MQMKLIETKPTIDGIEGKPADARLPPVVPDRRFRRICPTGRDLAILGLPLAVELSERR